jgi:alpha/beta superfamily hydrolase
VNAQSQRFTLQGPAGAIECLRDETAQVPRGLAVIAHPHPLFGGTMDNKVVQTLARAFVQAGWTALRFNFRGVGQSQGQFDEGHGEADDMRWLIEQAAPQGALALAGFSFGSFVLAQLLAPLWLSRSIEKVVLVGVAASRFDVAALPPQSHERTLIVHGEQDETVPLAAVMDWARPQSLPITVIPGASHFFHGQLPLLKSLALRHLNAPPV